MSPAGRRRGRAAHLRAGLVAWVALFGTLGTAARAGVTELVPDPDGLPVATVVVNVVGAFLLGAVLEALARRGPDVGRRRLLRLGAGTGFLGAFTTYSTFAVDADLLVRDGRTGMAAAYVVLTLVAGLVATVAGIGVASAHHRARRDRA